MSRVMQGLERGPAAAASPESQPRSLWCVSGLSWGHMGGLPIRG